MKRIYILLTVCLAMIACKQNDVNFSFSPEAPRAGQSVKFTNLSSSGEEWEWNFGDGITSTIKSPSHTYKQPGSYQVILKVDGKNAWTATKEVVVYDTIPTFVANDSIFYIYENYTFTANLYNPYKYPVTYEWYFPINTPYAEVVYPQPGEGWGPQITVYFTKPMEKAPISLMMVVNGDTTYVEKEFEVRDRDTHALAFRTAEGDYSQRIFGERAEYPRPDGTIKALLDAVQDTMQVYNGHTFTLTELRSTFSDIEGFAIVNRKIYYRADGLWVAAIDGSRRVQIDEQPCTAMLIEPIDNRIYWANNEGVWYMPLIGSDNNQFVTKPTPLNTLKVEKMGVKE